MTGMRESSAKTAQAARESLRLHPFYKGKIQILPKCPISALAKFARDRGLSETAILPRMDEWQVAAHVAAAAATRAQEQGLARIAKSAAVLYAEVCARIESARVATTWLMREGLIAKPPA